ncbi:MAG: Plug domain-containing protein [Saprospiraceae bacterium]
MLPILTLEEKPMYLEHVPLLPGILHSGDNGMGGLHSRGGDTDQNLVLLDGVPVYNSGHIFHLFSIFNNEIVQNTRVLKGGFPSQIWRLHQFCDGR